MSRRVYYWVDILGMSFLSRSILFICLLAVFALTAPLVFLYMQGYRIDFEAKKVVKTGGLYFKISPRDAQISFDGKEAVKTDFLFGAKLIDNLLPKEHELLVEKSGYWPWQKNLKVREEQVVEIKNILLIPKDINFTILAKNAAELWGENQKIVYKESSASSDKGKSQILYTFDPQTGSITYSVPKAQPAGKKEVPLLPASQTIFYQKQGSDIYYLDPLGWLYKTNESLEQKIKINETAIAIVPKAKYELWLFESFTFLRQDNTVYLLDPGSKTFEKFFETLSEIEISPDGQKMLYFSDSEIQILFLKDKEDEPLKKAGDKIVLVRLSDKITDAVWLNSHYIIFSAGSKIKAAEIDDRDKINIVTISNLPAKKLVFLSSDKKLYLLSETTLYSSDKIIQ